MVVYTIVNKIYSQKYILQSPVQNVNSNYLVYKNYKT